MKYAFIISLFALLLSGCNTVHGVGEDVSAGGHAISHASDDVAGKD